MKLKIKLPLGSLRILVPRVGLEPTHLAAGDFESPASTNFATWAGGSMLCFLICAALKF